MNEPEIITDVITLAPPRRALVPLTFRRTYRLSDGRAESTVNRGETAGVPADQVAFLLRQQIAVAPGASLDVPAPDVTPTAIRLLRAWQTVRGQHFGAAERAALPRFEADRLIGAGAAVLDDGTDPITTSPEMTRRRSRIQARGRQIAEQVLERYR